MNNPAVVPIEVVYLGIGQEPQIAPHREDMRARLAGALGVSAELVNVRATTTDRLGFTGRGEGLAAQAIALLRSA